MWVPVVPHPHQLFVWSVFLLIYLFVYLKITFIFEREKERERDRARAGEGQRDREAQNPKQAPGSELSAKSPMWGLNS